MPMSLACIQLGWSEQRHKAVLHKVDFMSCSSDIGEQPLLGEIKAQT